MPEENGDGKSKTGVLEKAKDSAAALRETLTEKAKQQATELKEPEKTQLYRSIFRVKHDAEPRNRALSVLSNVFLHLGHGLNHFLPLYRPHLYWRSVDVLLPPDESAGLPRHPIS